MATLDEKKLKALLKSAVTDALEKQRKLMREVMEETMEDIGLLRAMEQGQTGRLVSKERIFGILDAKKK